MGGCGKRLLRDKVCVQVRQRDSGCGGAGVDPDDTPPFLVWVEESRSPSAEGVTVRALRYPSLIDQLFCDHRNRAALKPGVTGQIRTRNGLMTANQIEHYAAVDVSRRLARRNLK